MLFHEREKCSKRESFQAKTLNLNWMKNADKIKTAYELGQFGPNRKKMRTAKFDDVDEATLKTFVPKISRIQQQAAKFAKDLRQETWKASPGISEEEFHKQCLIADEIKEPR
ncbi:hypothetical protein CHS0354_035772 [Potamilus streckersoni]|uniref:Uncharacterized protein n=1 Tax=Potamilus streckersoni TaxID=2493646 RepID=A0AAE0VLY8_9BIVA|nr:hypothetical protein CHS0354_035772 [Potamilus streckersoni]